MAKKNSHCSYCGQRFVEGAAWPRTCEGCRHTSFLNPTPVAVLLAPVSGGGVLAIRRGIEPKRGEIALPGGFIDWGESWQEACVRECYEETQIEIPPEEVELFHVGNAPQVLLVFGRLKKPLNSELWSAFVPTSETTERLVLTAPQDLAFPLHTQALQSHFDGL